MFELLEPIGVAALHEPFVAKVKVAEQFVQAVELQTAQFDEQAWHPGTGVVYPTLHCTQVEVLLWNQHAVMAVPVWQVPFETK